MKYKIIKIIFSILAIFGLDKIADKAYWNIYHGFKPASKATLVGIEKAFKITHDSGVLQKGDYLEFGVFKGYSIFHAQKLAKKYNTKMKLFGFDSFAGLPTLESKDAKKEFYEGQFSQSKKRVSGNIVRHGGNLKTIKLIEGFFSDSLNAKTKKKYEIKKASIVNIDSDLYSSAVDVLNFIKPLIMEGTILLFDDWNSMQGEKQSGEEIALKEFLKKNKSVKLKKLYSYGWHGQAFAVVNV